ncbi:MAG: serine protease AprX [Actinomycetota bacterium]|jgi:serine protease AprX
MTFAFPVALMRARTAIAIVILAMLSALIPAAVAEGALTRLIVQARPGHVGGAESVVEQVGGVVGTPLPLVDGFVAEVPAGAVATIAHDPAVRAVSTDDPIHFEELSYDATTTASNYPKTSGAAAGWSAGRYGEGVGVAIIDTGVSQMNDFDGRLVHGPDLSGEGWVVDSYGHGTVMAGIIGGSGADSATNPGGKYAGVAPKSTLVAVKVAGRNGAADVSTMLQAMHWVAAYKDQFNIRVLNLSWGTRSTQDPSVDPLNYAVQRLWDLGIVVVAAAGNSGPQAGTITKPADDPVVLSVGAFDDKQNVNPADDSIPAWSSRGPTAQGLTKPDLVAPGRTLVATRSYGSAVESENPKALVSPSYIKGSGTSEAAAVTSGLVAQLLEARPDLTPDQVKAILKGSTSPMSGPSQTYQGTGRINLANALAAPTPTATQVRTATGLGSLEASRAGMNVEADCDGDGTLEVIRGEIDVRCEEWNGGKWAGSAWTGSAWTGSAWTGSAWTGGKWAGSAWTGSAWTGSAWTGGKWAGSAWTGSAWTGSAWTGSAWTGGKWAGSAWAGSAWTGSAWTTAEYEEELYLTAFWGSKPKPGKRVAGEEYTPVPGRGKGMDKHAAPAQ